MGELPSPIRPGHATAKGVPRNPQHSFYNLIISCFNQADYSSSEVSSFGSRFSRAFMLRLIFLSSSLKSTT